MYGGYIGLIGLGVRSVIGGYIGFGILGAGSSEKSAGPCKGARDILRRLP